MISIVENEDENIALYNDLMFSIENRLQTMETDKIFHNSILFMTLMLYQFSDTPQHAHKVLKQAINEALITYENEQKER